VFGKFAVFGNEIRKSDTIAVNKNQLPAMAFSDGFIADSARPEAAILVVNVANGNGWIFVTGY